MKVRTGCNLSLRLLAANRGEALRGTRLAVMVIWEVVEMTSMKWKGVSPVRKKRKVIGFGKLFRSNWI